MKTTKLFAMRCPVTNTWGIINYTTISVAARVAKLCKDVPKQKERNEFKDWLTGMLQAGIQPSIIEFGVFPVAEGECDGRYAAARLQKQLQQAGIRFVGDPEPTTLDIAEEILRLSKEVHLRARHGKD